MAIHNEVTDAIGSWDLKSEAKVAWLYNKLIIDGMIRRPISMVKSSERRYEISQVEETKFKNLGPAQTKQWRNELDTEYQASGLRDGDIRWIKELSHDQVFLCWLYVATTYGQKRKDESQSGWMSEFYEHYPLKFYDADAESANNLAFDYLSLGLESSPATKEGLLSNILDFVSIFNPSFEVKSDYLIGLKAKVDEASVCDYFKFAEDGSLNQIKWLWSYLRKTQKMPGQIADSMEKHGLSRVYGAFHLWGRDPQFKNEIIRLAKTAYKNSVEVSTGGRKARVNLTLSTEVKELLEDMAGGSRYKSQFVENLILNAKRSAK
ncbi:hypothetical protein [Idiomarina sp. ST10R2A5]|uniref:hypothetical protein n=1 Tax=Idiomarina sp. ST10R2A5 TaxID=3418368 RepID=UPI003EC6D891